MGERYRERKRGGEKTEGKFETVEGGRAIGRYYHRNVHCVKQKRIVGMTMAWNKTN